MSECDLVVIRVVSRRTFHDACTKTDLDVFIADDRKLFTIRRIYRLLADQMIYFLIVWIDDYVYSFLYQQRKLF